MTDTRRPDEPREALQEAQINRALGVFLLFFAAIVAISIFFTDSTIGKLTNLGAASVIGLVGGVLAYRGKASGPRDTS